MAINPSDSLSTKKVPKSFFSSKAKKMISMVKTEQQKVNHPARCQNGLTTCKIGRARSFKAATRHTRSDRDY
jgi:hypothetical protein